MLIALYISKIENKKKTKKNLTGFFQQKRREMYIHEHGLKVVTGLVNRIVK
jgi:hypothetical protein